MSRYYYNPAKWPTLSATLKDIINNGGSGFMESLESYDELLADDRAEIIAAYIADTPDRAELFSDLNDDFISYLEMFVRRGNEANSVREQFINNIEAAHKDFLEGFFNQMLEEAEQNQHEHARNFWQAVNQRIDEEMRVGR